MVIDKYFQVGKISTVEVYKFRAGPL